MQIKGQSLPLNHWAIGKGTISVQNMRSTCIYTEYPPICSFGQNKSFDHMGNLFNSRYFFLKWKNKNKNILISYLLSVHLFPPLLSFSSTGRHTLLLYFALPHISISPPASSPFVLCVLYSSAFMFNSFSFYSHTFFLCSLDPYIQIHSSVGKTVGFRGI